MLRIWIIAAALWAAPVHAGLITLENGETWNITTVTGSFWELEDTLTQQPWWGPREWQTAFDFAWATGYSVGRPNYDGLMGPLFMHYYDLAHGVSDGLSHVVSEYNTSQFPTLRHRHSLTTEFTYAVAEPIAAPIPGALWLFLTAIGGLVYRSRISR